MFKNVGIANNNTEWNVTSTHSGWILLPLSDHPGEPQQQTPTPIRKIFNEIIIIVDLKSSAMQLSFPST